MSQASRMTAAPVRTVVRVFPLNQDRSTARLRRSVTVPVLHSFDQ